jgi:hypothetical protein
MNGDNMSAIVLRHNEADLAQLLVYAFKGRGYQSFFLRVPDFRAPMEKQHHPVCLVYTDAPMSTVMQVVTYAAEMINR